MSPFPLYQNKLYARLQSVFTASSELLLSPDDLSTARLSEQLEGFHAFSDQALLYLMEADGLLSIDAMEPFQSSLPLTLSSTTAAFHTHPFALMQQQQQTMAKLRHRHHLLTSVSQPYLPHPPPPQPPPTSSLESNLPISPIPPPTPRSLDTTIDLIGDDPAGSSSQGSGRQLQPHPHAQAVRVEAAPSGLSSRPPSRSGPSPPPGGGGLMEVLPPVPMEEQRSVMDLTDL